MITIDTKSALTLDFFRRQGYLLMKNALDRDVVCSSLEFLRLQANTSKPPFRRNKDGEITRLANVVSRENGILVNILLNKVVRDTLKLILGPNIVLVLNRHNHATRNVSGDTTPRFHRDVLQWSRPVLTAVFYLEPAGLAEGCTWIIPGSQYLPQTGIPNNGGSWLDEQPEIGSFQEYALPVPVAAGDVLFFDSLMFHSIGQNSTKSTRWAIILAFRSVDELSATNDPSVHLVEGAAIYRGNELGDEPPSDLRKISL